MQLHTKIVPSFENAAKPAEGVTMTPPNGSKYRAIVDTHRHPVGAKLRDKMAEAGLFDPRKPLPQANAQDFFATRDFLDLDYGVSQQRAGGITLSIASNGGEVDWISGLLKVSTVDALKFLRDEDLEIQDRFPGEFERMANAHALEESCRPVVEENIKGGAKAIAVSSSYGDGTDRVFLHPAGLRTVLLQRGHSRRPGHADGLRVPGPRRLAPAPSAN